MREGSPDFCRPDGRHQKYREVKGTNHSNSGLARVDNVFPSVVEDLPHMITTEERPSTNPEVPSVVQKVPTTAERTTTTKDILSKLQRRGGLPNRLLRWQRVDYNHSTCYTSTWGKRTGNTSPRTSSIS